MEPMELPAPVDLSALLIVLVWLAAGCPLLCSLTCTSLGRDGKGKSRPLSVLSVPFHQDHLHPPGHVDERLPRGLFHTKRHVRPEKVEDLPYYTLALLGCPHKSPRAPYKTAR